MLGYLTEEQAAKLAAFVRGRTVMELGAGDLELANRMLEMGAEHVIAVDSHFPRNAARGPGITCLEVRFRDLEQREDVVVLNHPPLEPTGLPRILEDAAFVIYLGKNTDATACGEPAMWNHLVRREVLAYEPTPTNVLIVYGPHNTTRSLIGEERGALSRDKILSYDESEAATWIGREVSQLGLATVTEHGAHFETEISVCFTFIRNEEPSPYFGPTYQQDLEPAGRYMLHASADMATHVAPGWSTGQQCFRSPLVLVHNAADPTEESFDAHSWKARLSRHYHASGRKLSRALLSDGFDGIVTARFWRGEWVTSEIVALMTAKRPRVRRLKLRG